VWLTASYCCPLHAINTLLPSRSHASLAGWTSPVTGQTVKAIAFFSLGLAVCDASTWRLSVTSIARKSLFPRESGPPRVPADSSSSSAYLSTLIKSGLASGLVTMTCAFYGRVIHSQFLKLGGVRISPLIWIEIHMWLSPGCVWVARTIPKWASGAGTVVCYLRKRRRRC
jgi:hypothetical protein